MKVAAIDQGTTSTRLFMVDHHHIQAVCSLEHKQFYPRQGWVEHNPAEIMDNIQTCLGEAIRCGAEAVAIANQGESCLAWNAKTKQPLSPIIVWQDQRTEDRIKRLKADGMEAEVLSRSGLPLDSYFSASKLRWLLDNTEGARDLLKKGHLRIGTTDTFFLDQLCGVCVSDVSTASRTSLMNLQTLSWDTFLCEAFGIPPDVLPDIKPTSTLFGTIPLQGRELPVLASATDQQAALYGHGCTQAGDMKITFGTGAFVLGLTGHEPSVDVSGRLNTTLAWQQEGHKPLYALEGGVYNAASALNWARSLGLFQTFADIGHFDRPPAIDRGIVFVPALSGLACPYWDRGASGAWLGLSLDTEPLDMVQALLEGVALRAAQIVRLMQEKIPIQNFLSVDGGLSRNPYFLEFLASVLQQDIRLPKHDELTAVGIARFADRQAHSAEQEGSFVQPAVTNHDWLGKFDEAVSFSRAWQRPETAATL